MTPNRTSPSPPHAIAIGIACGAGAAVFWATGFVAARHGIDLGFTPADITFHRCFWAGLVLLPLALRDGIGDLNGIGWGRGIVLTFFGGLGIAFAVTSIVLAVPIFATFLEQGTVPRFPTAILSTGLMLLAFLFAIAGLILDTVTKGRREMKLLAYLAQRAPGADGDRRQG